MTISLCYDYIYMTIVDIYDYRVLYISIYHLLRRARSRDERPDRRAITPAMFRYLGDTSGASSEERAPAARRLNQVCEF